MRAAAPDVDQGTSRLGDHRRPRGPCFVTGTPRAECACAECRRTGR
jgi:hypothetical protein